MNKENNYNYIQSTHKFFDERGKVVIYIYIYIHTYIHDLYICIYICVCLMASR